MFSKVVTKKPAWTSRRSTRGSGRAATSRSGTSASMLIGKDASHRGVLPEQGDARRSRIARTRSRARSNRAPGGGAQLALARASSAEGFAEERQMLEARDRDRPADIDDRHRPAPMLEQRPRPAPPSVMVIFGASGDPTRRKLVPALHNLRRGGLLPDEFAVLGVARQPLTDDDFRERISEQLADSTSRSDPACRQWVLERSFYLGGDIEQPGIYEQIKKRLADIGRRVQDRRQLSLLPRGGAGAVRPGRAASAASRVSRSRRTAAGAASVIGKPFGVDPRVGAPR